ncbi:MAG TPA: DUF2190 family protein [Bryobacteraceae bacterium]|nr:DUF2190 family protein [Bryobacteraceae bacterium]
MNIILIACIVLALIATGIFAYRSSSRLDRRAPIFSNAVPAAFLSHGADINRVLDADVSTRWLLAKQGIAANSVAVCGATDRPIGIMDDVGEAGESITMLLLGTAPRTLPGVAAVSIAVGDKLYTAAGGKVTNVSATGVYVLGHALTASPADGIVEIDPLAPTQVAAEPPTASHYVFAAGIHTWAGGADTTDSISIDGLTAADVILVTSATGPAVASAVKGTGETIDVTLASAGTNGTTKLNYGVLRANS